MFLKMIVARFHAAYITLYFFAYTRLSHDLVSPTNILLCVGLTRNISRRFSKTMFDDMLKHMTAEDIKANYDRLQELCRISNTINELMLKLAYEKAMCELDPRRVKNMMRIYHTQLETCFEDYEHVVKLIRTVP